MKRVCWPGRHFFLKGFSLIEIIMVMVIVAVSSAVIMPRIVEFFDDTGLHVESRKLMTEIRYVQQKAVTEYQRYRIQFYTNTPSYDLDIYVGAGNWTTFRIVRMDHGVSISSTDYIGNILEFTPFGSPVESGSIFMRNPDGNINEIKVHPVTGKVEL